MTASCTDGNKSALCRTNAMAMFTDSIMPFLITVSSKSGLNTGLRLLYIIPTVAVSLEVYTQHRPLSKTLGRLGRQRQKIPQERFPQYRPRARLIEVLPDDFVRRCFLRPQTATNRLREVCMARSGKTCPIFLFARHGAKHGALY